MEETKKAMTAIKNELVDAMIKGTDVANIDSKLMKLGCLMRKMDVAEDAEKIKLHEADEIIKELKIAAKKFPKTSAAKKISGMFGWLTKHGGSSRRYGVVKSKKCSALNPPIDTGYKGTGILGDALKGAKKGLKAAGNVGLGVLDAVTGHPVDGLARIGDAVTGADQKKEKKKEGADQKKEKKKEGAPKKEPAKKKNNRLREEMPAYLLNAITKEKPAHPVYGKLRY